MQTSLTRRLGQKIWSHWMLVSHGGIFSRANRSTWTQTLAGQNDRRIYNLRLITRTCLPFIDSFQHFFVVYFLLWHFVPQKNSHENIFRASKTFSQRNSNEGYLLVRWYFRGQCYDHYFRWFFCQFSAKTLASIDLHKNKCYGPFYV
jgi:hypothetical protein